MVPGGLTVAGASGHGGTSVGGSEVGTSRFAAVLGGSRGKRESMLTAQLLRQAPGRTAFS